MRVVENFDLTEFNSYRIEAYCRQAFFPENEVDVVIFFKTHKRHVILGSGHNIIFSKKYYDLPFLIFSNDFSRYKLDVDAGLLEAESGAFMTDLSCVARDSGLSGLEVFYDIPSSLGGAIVMNAGASGEDIDQLLVSVRYLDLNTFEVAEKSRNELYFKYRNGTFQKDRNKIILSAILKLTPGDFEEISGKMEDVKKRRWAKQPRNFPNAGSVFKRPPGHYVGALVESLGLKGFSIGGAKVSEKHAGFIINVNGTATGTDICKLIAHVQREVQGAYGVDLEVEQRIV
jgi:UDP-N-acetylmuramate dehydrogenase